MKLIKTIYTLSLILFVGFSSNVSAITGEQTAASSQLLSSEKNDSSFWFAQPGKWGDVVTLPGSSFAAASGLVSSWGVIFGSLNGISNNKTGGPATNGGAGIGFGIGDSSKIGGAISLSLPSVGLGADNATFMGQGDLNVTLGHLFITTLTGVSVGVSGISAWNYGGGGPKPSYNIALSQIVSNDYVPLMLNFGVGNNSFGFIRSTRDPSKNFAPFISIGAYLLPQLSVIGDYTGGITTAGISIVPVAKLPIVISLGARDLFGYQAGQNNPAFVASASYAYVF